MAAKAMPAIVEEYVPGPGSRAQGYKREVADPGDMGWRATPAQLAASQAAQEAISAGKPSTEVFEAAKAAFDAVKRDAALPSGQPGLVNGDQALMERYLRACVSLHTGRPCTLSGRQLMDVLCLIDEPVVEYERWLESIKVVV